MDAAQIDAQAMLQSTFSGLVIIFSKKCLTIGAAFGIITPVPRNMLGVYFNRERETLKVEPHFIIS